MTKFFSWSGVTVKILEGSYSNMQLLAEHKKELNNGCVSSRGAAGFASGYRPRDGNDNQQLLNGFLPQTRRSHLW